MSQEVMVTVATRCPFCGKLDNFDVPLTGYERWKAGELVQRALPSLSAGKREQLISGTCPTCWDKQFNDR